MTCFRLSRFSKQTLNEWLAAGQPPFTFFPEKNAGMADDVQPGDIFLMYVGKPHSVFIGAMKVVGVPKRQAHTLWRDSYPIAIPCDPISLVPIKEGIPYLSIPDLPTMPGNKPGYQVPNRGQTTHTGTLINNPSGSSILSRLHGDKNDQLSFSQRVTRTEEPSCEVSQHSLLQAEIGSLGIALGYRVFIPRADQGKKFNNSTLGQASGSLERLPQIVTDDESMRVIKEIDVLWLAKDRNLCVAAFEVECSTTIYSGFLRMLDLLILNPNLRIPLYIVAPVERFPKYCSEIKRPSFEHGFESPLRNHCRFISASKISELLALKYVKDLKVDVLASAAEDNPK
jgi:hypothetical protein